MNNETMKCVGGGSVSCNRWTKQKGKKEGTAWNKTATDRQQRKALVEGLHPAVDGQSSRRRMRDPPKAGQHQTDSNGRH